MGTLNQDTTYFTDVAFGSTQIGLAAPGKYINIDNLYDGTYDPLEGEVAMSVNAIEIDWNGADMGNTVDSTNLTPGEQIIIKTTGQLLSYISVLGQKITNLENILINI